MIELKDDAHERVKAAKDTHRADPIWYMLRMALKYDTGFR